MCFYCTNHIVLYYVTVKTDQVTFTRCSVKFIIICYTECDDDETEEPPSKRQRNGRHDEEDTG